MKLLWLGAVEIVSILVLGAHSATLGFPNFPTVDDYGVVVGSKLALVNSDISYNEAPAPIKMTHMRVRSEISLRYARTAIICNVYNPSKRPQENIFSVMLPETAFISGFTMTIGKETYEAYVKQNEVAKKIYNDAVAQGVSAAHIATKARDSNHITIKFNVEGRSNATYHLRYEEFLVRRNGVYNHAINLHPGSLVPKMDVVIQIKESQKISVLRVPELRTGNEVDATEEDAQYVKAVIKKSKSERQATITFTPDIAEQTRLAELYAIKRKKSSDPDFSNIGYDSREEENTVDGYLGQFVVQYDVEQPNNGEILLNDGYFVHFFAPSYLPPMRKHVVFVLDTSGSMAGNKMSQLIKAMNAILSDLKPTDYFSIIEFNSYVKVHDLKEADTEPDNLYNKNKMALPSLASPENIEAAKVIVSRFHAYGGTNIFDALDEALKLIQVDVHQPCQTDSTNDTTLVDKCNGTESHENNLEPMIIFLTDGYPTVGKIGTEYILYAVSKKNSGEKKVPLFTLAFGDGAARGFLRKLSLSNYAFMRHIYDEADAALQLHDFYRQVSSPLLADVKFQYPRRQIKEKSVSRSQFRTINYGEEVAVVGKIAENVEEFTPKILGIRSDEDGRRTSYEINPKVPVPREKDEYLPLERLWAYLTIKQLLDKVIAGFSSTNDDPGHRAIDIALKYSFVTPLTSLVVVRLNKTDVKDNVNVERVDEPSFSPFRSPTCSLKATTYSGFASGGGLSVNSSDGPVLFAQSSNISFNSHFIIIMIAIIQILFCLFKKQNV